MDFSWHPEIARQIRDFEELAAGIPPRAAGTTGLDREGWNALATAGLTRLIRQPDAHSPSGGLLGVSAVLDALGRSGIDRGLLFAMGAHLFGCQLPLLLYGSEAQRARWSEPLASARAIGALAVTESQGGSNPGAMQTRAEAAGDGFVLDGAKTLITNAPDADLFLVLAATRPDRGTFGWSAFLVPRDTAGVSVASLDALGLSGAPMGTLTLDHCQVPRSALLGALDQGLRVFTSAMLWERTGILAGFLGAALRDLDAAIGYLNDRRDSDGPLAAHQSLAHRMAVAKVRVESARLLLFRAAWAVDHRQRNSQQMVSMAKYAASEAVLETALDLVRVTAGAGWLDRMGVANALRDAVGTLFASGTSEVQLNIIAASMGLKRR